MSVNNMSVYITKKQDTNAGYLREYMDWCSSVL